MPDEDLFDWSRKKERPPCPFPVPLDVCTLFEKLALEVFSRGWEHYSARAILHRIRWHYEIEVGERGFKANNNWTPALARWFMKLHPETGDFFHTRASPGEGGPGHDAEDYMGPFEGR